MGKPKKDPALEPWERQPGEGIKAFHAFATYRDMGPARSIRQVSRELAKSRTLICRWSSTHDWVKRAEAWDVERDRIARLAAQKVMREMNRRQARSAVAIQVKMLEALAELDPACIKAQDLARLLELGMKYERIARGADAVTQQADEDSKPALGLADAIEEAYKRRSAPER